MRLTIKFGNERCRSVLSERCFEVGRLQFSIIARFLQSILSYIDLGCAFHICFSSFVINWIRINEQLAEQVFADITSCHRPSCRI